MARPSSARFDESEHRASNWTETALAEIQHQAKKKETPDPEERPPGTAICTECGRLCRMRHHGRYCVRCVI